MEELLGILLEPYLAVRAVAVHGVDIEIRAVGLGRKTIVVNVDPGSFDMNR